MPSRLVTVLVFVAALIYACGPRSHSSESTGNRTVDGPPIVTALDVTVKNGVSFALHVTNNATRRIELTFPSGQTHDIVVLDSIGREVWRWSEGRMFTQALQNRVIESSETLTYEATWKALPPAGNYVVVAQLMSENQPVEQRAEFSIP
jgi:hypothetical protein